MKKYMLLFLILSLSVLCLFGCGRRENKQDNHENTENLATDESLLVDTAVVDAAEKTLEYCDGNVTVRLRYTEETNWVWVDEPTFPLNGDMVEELLAALRELGDLPALPLGGEPDLFGLDDPYRYLTMEVEEGRLHLSLGDQADDGTWYMAVEGYEGIYACPDSFMKLMQRSLYDMAVLPAVPAFTAENILRVTVENAEGSVALHKVDGQWKSSHQRITERAEEVLACLSSMQVSRCFDFLPSSQAIHLCGFSQPTASITVEYLNSVNVESSFQMTLGALRSAEEGYYLTMGEDNTIYLVPSTTVSPLLVLLIYAK